MKIAQLYAFCLACLTGILSVTAFSQTLTISADGTEVTDRKFGLIWRRCVEGMNWDGAMCSGVANTFTYEAALRQAMVKVGSASPVWRLPDVNELSSIADRGRINAAVDPAAFPVTPPNWFWSASPYLGNSGFARVVNFFNGSVYVSNRNHSGYVRLVRTGQ